MAPCRTMSEVLTPDDLAQVERNKDKCNMRPELEFVEKHRTQYLGNVQRFLDQRPNDLSYTCAQGIEFMNYPMDPKLQIVPQDITNLVARLSPDLTQLSHLKTVDYTHHGKVAVPNFDKNGNLDKDKPCSGVIPTEEYENGDYKQRMLIGSTSLDGERITLRRSLPRFLEILSPFVSTSFTFSSTNSSTRSNSPSAAKKPRGRFTCSRRREERSPTGLKSTGATSQWRSNSRPCTRRSIVMKFTRRTGM